MLIKIFLVVIIIKINGMIIIIKCRNLMFPWNNATRYDDDCLHINSLLIHVYMLIKRHVILSNI